jgi:hypothetical protein
MSLLLRRFLKTRFPVKNIVKSNRLRIIRYRNPLMKQIEEVALMRICPRGRSIEWPTKQSLREPNGGGAAPGGAIAAVDLQFEHGRLSKSVMSCGMDLSNRTPQSCAFVFTSGPLSKEKVQR